MRKAFTMIELIFVIVIIAILSAIAIPKINKSIDEKETAKQEQSYQPGSSQDPTYWK